MINLVPFGSTCNLQNGRAFKPEEWSVTGTPIIRIQNLNDESKPFNYCNFEIEERFHVSSGDLLFSWSGTPGTSFGAFFWNRGKGFLNQHIFRVDVDEKEICKNYLRYAINSKINLIIDQAHGGVGLKHITKGKLEAIEIPLPPLSEQKRIAAILDKADAIRRKRQQAIQLADDFLRAVFLDMFGDPVTNPKGWGRVSLRDIIMDWTPGVTIQPSDFTDNGFHVLHKGAVQRNGRIEIDQRKKTFTSTEFAKANSRAVIDSEYLAVNLRDLVPTGPSIGLVADLSVYGSKEYLLAYGAYGFKVDRNKIVPDYLIALTNDSGFRREFARVWVGSTQIHIRKDDFFDLEIPFPDFECQKKYKLIVESVRKISASKMKKFDGDKFFFSLSQEAFRGEM